MSKIICYCNNVTELEIKAAIEKGAKTIKDIQLMTNACNGRKCIELNPSKKCCSSEINMLLR